ncbi:MAG: preprotein translocase subunit SecE [Spirulinaceae cyanobacterium RM2_2_10]|nr:preprotein translocase subunit SecE [Spirulinaceae cyanobacterium SM2_1_0]NJO20576.1 preprotein translocase subunit SecE [Spirulinaceae cyanobacterium RM2_2_10]
MAKAKKDLVKNDAVKESTKPVASKSKDNDGSFNLVKFLAESREEFDKIVWPSRQQLASESAAVILMVILVATTVYFVDNLFLWLSGRVF